MHISELRISHLRSFTQETSIRLQPGLNVIVGANGTGKSNALDAVLFALVQETALLRVRSWSELSNRARAGPCAVRLTISDAGGDPQLIVLANVKEQDGSRQFKLNGTISTASQVRAALLQLGLDTTMPSFAVRQHAAMRPIDDDALTALLQQASGASTFAATAALSKQQLSKEKEGLTRVNADIHGIESLLERERVAHQALCEIRKLTRRESRGLRAMGALAAELASATVRRQQESEAQRSTQCMLPPMLHILHICCMHCVSFCAPIDLCIVWGAGEASQLERSRIAHSVLEELQQAIEQLALRSDRAKQQARDQRVAATAASRVAGRAREAVREAEVELLHGAILVEQTAQEQASLTSECERTEYSSHERRLGLCRLRGRLRAAEAAASETEASVSEVHTAMKRVAAATSGGWLVEGTLATLTAQTEARLDVAQVAAPTADLTEVKARLEVIALEHGQRHQELAAEVTQLDELATARRQADLQLAQAQALATSVVESLDDCTAAVATAEAKAAEAEDMRRRATLQLRRYEPSTDELARGSTVAAPTLCSILYLAEDDERLPRCLTALELIAGRHLGVRLTATADEAVQLLAGARKRGEGVRVWPLDTLRAADRTASHAKLQRTYGKQDVVLPTELVAASSSAATASAAGRPKDPSTGTTGAGEATDALNGGAGAMGDIWPALLSAFGSSLIVSTDHIASKLVREHGVRCVTMDGNIHEPGKLQGGYRPASQLSSFAALLARQQATARAALANARLIEVRHKRELLRASKRSSEAAASATSLHEAAASRVTMLRSSIETLREEWYLVATTAAEQEAHMATAPRRVDALQAEVASLGDASDGGGTSVQHEAVQTLLRTMATCRAQCSNVAKQQLERAERDVLRCEQDATDSTAAHGLQFEAEAMAEQHQEQQAALERATLSLRQCEIELDLMERREAEVEDAATSAATLDSTLRDETRRLTQKRDATRVAAAAADAEAAALAQSATAGVPSLASKWLGAAATAAASARQQDGGSDCDDGEDDGNLSMDGAGAVDEDDDDESDVDAEGRSSLSLEERLQAGEVKLATWQRQRQDLERTHGSPAALGALLVACGSAELLVAGGGGAGGEREADGACGTANGGVAAAASGRLATLQQLQRKARTVTESIERLTAGIEEMKTKVATANAEVVTCVREATKRAFEQLVPSMEVDIECADPAELETHVARFRIRSKDTPLAATTSAGAGEWRYGLQELSGGQRTLLNLSLLLALARHRPSLVLLMDEVDAALDENNAARVAALLKELSARSQVIAISHRVEFHRAADHIVKLHKERDYTIVKDT